MSVSSKNLNPPRHVAVIPDGNRRWAKKRGLRSWEGHFAGIGKNAEEIAHSAVDKKIEYLTVWLGSYDNLTKRTKTEIKMLNEAYRRFINRTLNGDYVHKNGVRIRFLGEWPRVLEPKTIDLIRKAEDQTKKYKNYNLTALVAYSGDREMLDAIKKMLNKKYKVISDIDLTRHLWTGELPPVDLVIRTGIIGDPHNSTGFMMWHTRYSQFYFTSTLWPDFGKKNFLSAINSYLRRDRRFGK